MKKRLVISLLLLLALQLGTQAQKQYRKPLRSQSDNNLAMSDFTIGIKGGCPWSLLVDSDLTKVSYLGHFGYSVGIVTERYFPKSSVAFEALFSQKGTKMSSTMIYQSSIEGDDRFDTIHSVYNYKYNALTLRVPFTYYIKNVFPNNSVIPYVFIGPQVDVQVPSISIKEKEQPDGTKKKEVEFVYPDATITGDGATAGTVSMMMPLSVSVYGGVGIMSHIPLDGYPLTVKFELGANFGLKNLAVEGFSVFPKPGEKSIRAHDLEANVTVVVPIKKVLRDACYYFQHK